MARPSERTQIALNGRWRFALDRENVGRAAGWWSGPPEAAPVTELAVPGIWEQEVPGYDGVAWYWRRIAVDAAALGDRVARLHFGAVNYFAEVWVNGAYAGSHEGGYTPFDLDVTPWLRGGANDLAVRVIDPPKDEVGIDGIVLKETPCWRELESFNFGGIWQDVSLVLTPRIYVVDCFVRPRLTPGTAEVRLEVESLLATSAEVTAAIAVRPFPDGAAVATTRVTLAVPPGTSTHVTALPVDAPRLWSPDTPNLYVVEVELTAATGRDTLLTRFGFRELTLGDEGFLLNGRRTFLKGGFHEGFYPLTIAAPHDPAMVRRELAEAKRAGLNLLRFWQIPIHPLVLDLADEMGMLLMDEPPIEWLSDSPHAERRCRQEVRELVRRDRNHPSVVFWTILNEGGILAEFTRRGPAQFTAQEWAQHTVQRLRHDFCLEARALDPSRLIIDDSGGWVNGANLYLPDSTTPEPINDLHLYRRAPTDRATFADLKTLGQRDEPGRGFRLVRGGLPVLVSEFGYGSLPDFPALVEGYRAAGAREDAEDYVQIQRATADLERVFQEQRLDEVFPSVSALCLATQRLQAEGNRRQMEALRANPLVGGYVMHAFSAGGVILCAEMVDLWRHPKPVCDQAALVHRPLHPIIELWPRVLRPGVPLPLQVTVAVDAEDAPGGDAEVTIAVEGGASRQTLFKGTVALRGPVTAVPLPPLTGRAGMPAAGDYRLVVTVRPASGLPVETDLPFVVLDPPPWEQLAGRVGIVPSGEGRLSHLLVARGVDAGEGLYAGEGGEAAACLIVAAPARSWLDPTVGRQVDEALAAAEAGATTLFLAPLAPADAEPARTKLPWLGTVRPAVGNWIPVGHYVRRHPFFAGLPAPGLMDWRYVDVCPTATLVDTAADEVPAGSVSLHATIYEKPERAWAGADVVVRRQGRGRVVLSQLPLLDQFGANPLAERLVFNLLHWALSGAGV